MRNRMRPSWTGVAALLVLAAMVGLLTMHAATASAATFTPLGDLPGGETTLDKSNLFPTGETIR